MQDIHSIGTGGGGGGGSRIFGGGVDRRLRTHNTLNHQQALKCPRCESVNTKFCYYNNYNLSQPRHFCKGCRRYWTRGGVLRNVPVGGGCRKPKRSAKPKQQPPSSSDVVAPPRRSNSHNSSSESSTTTAAGEVISGGSCSTVCPRLFNFPSESEFGSLNQTMEGGGPILSEEIGRLSEMMTSSAEMWSYRSEENKVVENGKRDEIEELPYMNDQMEFSESEKMRLNNNGGGMGWGVEEIFDQPYCWNQTQWPDHSFNYLP